jgi:hypothetical protein
MHRDRSDSQNKDHSVTYGETCHLGQQHEHGRCRTATPCHPLESKSKGGKALQRSCRYHISPCNNRSRAPRSTLSLEAARKSLLAQERTLPNSIVPEQRTHAISVQAYTGGVRLYSIIPHYRYIIALPRRLVFTAPFYPISSVLTYYYLITSAAYYLLPITYRPIS